MPDELTKYLKKIRAHEAHISHVIHRNGRRIKSFKSAWGSLRKRLSFGVLPDGSYLRIHDLRHCYATYLRMTGMKLDDIKELLGLKSVKMAQRYAHFDIKTVKEKVNKLSEVVKG